MSALNITVINVGSGDSIFIESIDNTGSPHYALIDSNDSNLERSTELFVRRKIQKTGKEILAHRLFEFVILSHTHADHGQGLKNVIQRFGATSLYYPNAYSWRGLTNLLSYANRSVKKGGRLLFHQQIDANNRLRNLGEATIEVLWPRQDAIPSSNENDNSIVLAISLGNVTALLTGDAETAVWHTIAPLFPANITFVKIPHHGAKSGSLDLFGNAPYIQHLESRQQKLVMAISCFPIPHGHPHQVVIDRINAMPNNPLKIYRTDEHNDITFYTNGVSCGVKREATESV